MILQRVRMAGSLIFRRALSLSLLPCVQGSREPCLLGYFLWRRVEPEYTGSWKPKSISSSQVQFRLQIFECWLFDELPLLKLMYRSQWKSLSYHLQVDKPLVFCVSSVISSSGPCMVSEAVCASGSRLRLWALWWTGVWHRWLQSLEHWRLGWSARDMILVGSHADAMANGPNGWLFVAAILPIPISCRLVQPSSPLTMLLPQSSIFPNRCFWNFWCSWNILETMTQLLFFTPIFAIDAQICYRLCRITLFSPSRMPPWHGSSSYCTRVKQLHWSQFQVAELSFTWWDWSTVMWFLFCVLFLQEMRQHMMSRRRQGQGECRSAGMSTPKSKALRKIIS